MYVERDALGRALRAVTAREGAAVLWKPDDLHQLVLEEQRTSRIGSRIDADIVHRVLRNGPAEAIDPSLSLDEAANRIASRSGLLYDDAAWTVALLREMAADLPAAAVSWNPPGTTSPSDSATVARPLAAPAAAPFRQPTTTTRRSISTPLFAAVAALAVVAIGAAAFFAMRDTDTPEAGDNSAVETTDDLQARNAVLLAEVEGLLAEVEELRAVVPDRTSSEATPPATDPPPSEPIGVTLVPETRSLAGTGTLDDCEGPDACSQTRNLFGGYFLSDETGLFFIIPDIAQVPLESRGNFHWTGTAAVTEVGAETCFGFVMPTDINLALWISDISVMPATGTVEVTGYHATWRYSSLTLECGESFREFSGPLGIAG